MAPKSRGRLQLQSADPNDRPILDAAFLSHPDDVTALAKGIELCRELGNSAAMRPFAKREVMPGRKLSAAELTEFVRNGATTYFHEVGTCRMGRDSTAVVDPQLRVNGVQNLRVADASVMPRIVERRDHGHVRADRSAHGGDPRSRLGSRSRLTLRDLGGSPARSRSNRTRLARSCSAAFREGHPPMTTNVSADDRSRGGIAAPRRRSRMTTAVTTSPEQEARRSRTVVWVVALAFTGLVFDGYDLVVYGAVLSTFLRDPSQIGAVTPALGGALGSYALVGVLVGALLAGTIADVIGRRKVMLLAYAWFSVGMAVTALMTTTTGFGLMRFVTGLGVGALVATTGAIVSEFAPPGKKNLCNAITYSGVPFGSLMAALLAIILLAGIGWRGMFWIGALPLVTLLPLAFFKMPESPAWLLSRGRVEEARAIAERTGVPLDEAPPAAAAKGAKRERVGFAGLFSGGNAFPAILLGFMSVTGLVLVYALNTWLPELMRRAGFSTQGSLAFLLVLNGGAILGALVGSRIADRFGPKLVVASCFLIGAVSIVLLTVGAPDRCPAWCSSRSSGWAPAAPRRCSSGSWPTTSARTSAVPRWRGAPGSAGSAGSAARCWAASWSPRGSR